RVVVDDRSIAREAGWADAEMDAELGQVLSEPPVRTATEVTVHATVGLPFQEPLAAWQVVDSAPRAPEAPRLVATGRRARGGEAEVGGARGGFLAGPSLCIPVRDPGQSRASVLPCPSRPLAA